MAERLRRDGISLLLPEVQSLRQIATLLVVRARLEIAQGRFDRMVAWRNRQVVDVALAEVVDRPFLVEVDGPLVRAARGLGVSFGD